MKNKIIIASLMAFSFLSACKKDDETKPALPTSETVAVSFSDEALSDKKYTTTDTLRNSLDLSVEFPANTNIEKVEVYVDGKLVSEDKVSPYAFKWNTINESEGNHTIKVVVYDKDGNKVEKTATVFVQNALLNLKTLTVNSTDGTRYIILSDEDGEILFSSKLENNKTYEIKLDKPYQKENVSITDVYVREDNVSAISYIGIKRGASWGSGYSDGVPANQSNVFVHLKNVPEFSKISIATSIGDKSILNLQQDTTYGMTLPYHTNTKLLVQIERQGEEFYDYLDISSGDINIDCSKITTPSSKREITTPAGTKPSSFLLGIENNSNGAYFLGYDYQPVENKAKFTYPSEIFSKYYCYMSYSLNNVSYSNYSIGSMPTSFNQLEASVAVTSSSLNNFNASFNGNFDYYNVNFGFSNFPTYYSWYVYAPITMKSFKLPEIASVIEKGGFNSENLKIQNISLTDYPNFTEDGPNFKYYRSNPSTVTFTLASTASYTQDNSGLRLKNVAMPTLDWKDMLNKIRKGTY
jgi:hypothetical protein